MFTLPPRTTRQQPRIPSFVGELRARASAPAIVGRTALTYRELADRVDVVAAALASSERRLVEVAVGSDVASLVGYLGALAAGHVVMPTPKDNVAAAAALRAAYDPDAVVTATATATEDVRIDVVRDRSAHVLHPDLALLLSTSGSTGSPKLVRLSTSNLDSNAAAIADYLAIRPTDRAAVTLPMHYCYGLSIVHSNLLAGAALMIDDRSVVDRCFWDEFTRCGATSIAGVPYTFDLLDRAGFEALELPSLRYITQAGGRLRPETVGRYARLGAERGWDLFVMYGQTEATARMAYLPPHLAVTRPTSIGVPIPGGDLTIDDGELVYRGPNVMLGYASSPADLAQGRVIHELRTGDLAVQADDGLFELVGRKTRFVKLFGLRVDLDLVESALGARGLEGACTGDDRRIVVAVTDEARSADAIATVRSVVEVPRSAVSVVHVDALPRLPSGKVDYPALALATATATATATNEPDVLDDTDPPTVPTPCDERAIAGLFADVLGRRDVAPSDSFVGLGGDSLSYVEASIGLEALVPALPLSWPTMTVTELASHCAGRRRTATGRPMRAIEMNVVLRAVAIVVIVGSHTSFMNVRGGAHVLLGVAGFNAARFHLGRVSTSAFEAVRGVLGSAARVAAPAGVWVGAWVALTDHYSLANVLMVHTFTGPRQWGERWQYWFIEALVHILLGAAVLLALPPTRKLIRSRGFELATGLAVVGIALRYDLLGVADHERLIHRADSVLWFFALGWAAYLATSARQRLVLTALLASGIPHYFESGRRESYVAIGVLALIWVARVRLPAMLVPPVRVLAASSLYIYLTHWQLYPAVASATSPLVALLASLGAGALAWWGVGRAGDLARRLNRSVSSRTQVRPRDTAGAVLASAA